MSQMFTVVDRYSGRTAATCRADYITRDSTYPHTIRFWVRGEKWWTRRKLVGAIENMSGTYIVTASAPTETAAEFLHDLGVKL